MPSWLNYLIWAAAAITALGVLIRQVVRPIVRMAGESTEMIALMQSLKGSFVNTPHAFEILDSIAGQFRTDAGSSLRDAIDRLETAAEDNRQVAAGAAEINHQLAESLKVGVEGSRLLAVEDRAQLARLMVLFGKLEAKTDMNLVLNHEAKTTAASVAADLAASHERADAVAADNQAPGETADAASRSQV